MTDILMNLNLLKVNMFLIRIWIISTEMARKTERSKCVYIFSYLQSHRLQARWFFPGLFFSVKIFDNQCVALFWSTDCISRRVPLQLCGHKAALSYFNHYWKSLSTFHRLPQAKEDQIHFSTILNLLHIRRRLRPHTSWDWYRKKMEIFANLKLSNLCVGS